MAWAVAVRDAAMAKGRMGAGDDALAASGCWRQPPSWGWRRGARMPASAVDVSPLESLAGRWVGEGRLGVKGNPTEQVKCRVTYIYAKAGDQLKQSIRCASAGGNCRGAERRLPCRRQAHRHLAGAGAQLSGDLTGAVTPRGFKVSVRGETLNANMDIIVIGTKQVVEIQFVNSSLIGLTLVLERG